MLRTRTLLVLGLCDAVGTAPTEAAEAVELPETAEPPAAAADTVEAAANKWPRKYLLLPPLRGGTLPGKKISGKKIIRSLHNMVV